MIFQRASQVSVTMVAALLAALWTFPAVWCFERDGGIRIKSSAPCTESSHCSGERSDAAGPDCTDVSIFPDGLTRDHPRVAGGNERLSQALAVPMMTAPSMFLHRAAIVSRLLCNDRPSSSTGTDLTTVLII